MSEENIKTDVKQEEGTKPEANDIPRSRLNEVIDERNKLRDELKTFEHQKEEARKAKLAEAEKWQELNAELSKEVESYKPFKERWESMDAKLREDALSKLPESKREKFSNVDTDVLLDIVSEFSERKQNPPDRQGTIPKQKLGNIHDMKQEDRKKNWSEILDSYRR